jgi:hypothetical protein
MNQHENQGESLKLVGISGAMVSKNVLLSEVADAHGVWKTSLIGPREEVREQYCNLRDERDRFIMLGDDMQASEITALMKTMEEEKWTDDFCNLVTTVGKNLALDTFLAGSGYTVTGPYIFLINTNASTAVIGDTMASHATWLEVGGANAPTYTSPRKTAAWSAASGGSKATSAAASFAITSSGTVGGCGLVFGSGAVSTIDSTAGTLYSAGAFTGGSKVVSNGDTLNVTYTASL